MSCGFRFECQTCIHMIRPVNGSMPVCNARPNQSHLSCWSTANKSFTPAVQNRRLWSLQALCWWMRLTSYFEKYSITMFLQEERNLTWYYKLEMTYLETLMACSWNSKLTISWAPALGYISRRSIIASRMLSTLWRCWRVWRRPIPICIFTNFVSLHWSKPAPMHMN